MGTRVVYGIHSVRQALQSRAPDVQRVFIQDDLGAERRARLADVLASVPGEPVRCPAAELERLTGTAKHQGIAVILADRGLLGEADARALVASIERPLVLVLDGIQDPRNFGSCLRTADAAGADLVVVGRSRNVDITPVVSKVAAGAAETQAIAQVGNLARFLGILHDEGVWSVGMDARAEQGLYDVDLNRGIALVLGAEGEGLRRLTRERCDFLVSLPMHGSVASLNVAVAAGICLYECVRQRTAGLPGGAHVR